MLVIINNYLGFCLLQVHWLQFCLSPDFEPHWSTFLSPILHVSLDQNIMPKIFCSSQYEGARTLTLPDRDIYGSMSVMMQKGVNFCLFPSSFCPIFVCFPKKYSPFTKKLRKTHNQI